MSDFDEKMMQKLKRLEREVERLQRWEKPIVVTDHGTLTGLGDNDHPQYLLTTGKAADSDKLDGIDSTGFVNTTSAQTVAGTKTFSSIPVLPSTNPTLANQAVRKGYADASYLGISAKAADSDKLDGFDSSDFGRPVFRASSLGSTSWDGDARSTTAKTLIDLSSVFGVPAGVKAVLVEVIVRDSASSSADYNGTVILSPNNTANSGLFVSAGGKPNDFRAWGTVIVPCDANGDIYYQILASGTGTTDVWLNIWGYFL